jgi:hypothetical protein
MSQRRVIRLSRRRVIQGLLAIATFGLTTQSGAARAFILGTSKESAESEQSPNAPILISGGSCGAAQMNQLNTVSCLSGFRSHKSPLQYAAGRCTCTRCGQSVPAGNPFP